MGDLPLCVRLDIDERASAEALKKDGWREIGVLATYAGFVRSEACGDVRRVPINERDEVVNMARAINWTGRLWRDAKIAKKVAWQETERFLRSAETIYEIPSKAFGVFWGSRIDLIGVLPDSRSQGLAEKIIRAWLLSRVPPSWNSAACGVWAGTYLDNRAAMRLYEKIGMKFQENVRVFHK